MIAFRRVPRAEMARRWAAKRANTLAPSPATAVANAEVVLELGDTVFLNFRGRAYGVPPVGWRYAKRLEVHRAALIVAARESAQDGRLASRYYVAMRRLARALWRHLQPVARYRSMTPILRLRKRLGLLHNPLLDATDKEVIDIADFFSKRRMTSSVGRQTARLQSQSTTP